MSMLPTISGAILGGQQYDNTIMFALKKTSSTTENKFD